VRRIDSPILKGLERIVCDVPRSRSNWFYIQPVEATPVLNVMRLIFSDMQSQVIILRLNSSCSRSMGLVVRALRHWLGGRRVKVNSQLQAFGDGTVLDPPLAGEAPATHLDLLAASGVDRIVVVGGDLVVLALGGVCQQVPVLVNRAPLDHGSPAVTGHIDSSSLIIRLAKAMREDRRSTWSRVRFRQREKPLSLTGPTVHYSRNGDGHRNR
jgi:hypothetical protein